MRVLRLTGICLVVAFACAAIGAAPGQAAEIGQCRLLLKHTSPKAKHGKYADGDCLTLFEKKGKAAAKGNFEWFPGPEPSCVPEKHGAWANASCTQEAAKAGKGSFERESCYGGGNGCAEYSSSSGKVELQTIPFTNPIECTTSTDLGEITGVSTGADTITLKNCSDYHDEWDCYFPSPGGEVVGFPLETALVTHTGGAWLKLSGKAAEFDSLVFAIFCQYRLPPSTVAALEVRPSVSGTIGPLNVMTKTFTEVFANSVGEQNLRTRETVYGIEAPDVLTMTATITTNASYEIKP